MAYFNIETTPEEQEAVIEALRNLTGKTISATAIAEAAGVNKHRVRYVLTDLIDAGKIARTPTKAFNQHYIRYKYEVLVK